MGTDTAGGPLFLVGAMGSGTTLMRLMLDSHPAIAIAKETGIARGVSAARRIPFWGQGEIWAQRLGWSDEERDTRIREFYGGFFDRWVAEQGKQRWGDKTPYHLWHVELLAELWPDAQFIATVRHPAAVAASNHARFDWSWQRAVGNWRRSNLELMRAISTLGERVQLCRYEDLVHDPGPVMRELLDWLGEPWADDVLDHGRVQREKGTDTEVEGRTRSTDAIDPGRAAKWEQQLPDEARERLEVNAALAGFYGYSLEQAQPVADLVADPAATRRWWLDGDTLAARRDADATVDWSETYKRALADREYSAQSLRDEIAEAQDNAVRRYKLRHPPPPPPQPPPPPPPFPARVRRAVRVRVLRRGRPTAPVAQPVVVQPEEPDEQLESADE